MVIDYKDVTFSFREKKRKRRLRQLRFLILVSVILCSLFLVRHFQLNKKIRKIQDLLLCGNLSEAGQLVGTIGNSLFHQKTVIELKGLIGLFNNEPEKAQSFFRKIHESKTSVSYLQFLNYFSDRARYRELQIYADYLTARGEDTTFWQALCQTAFFKPDPSEKSLNRLSAKQKKSREKEISILSRLNSQLKTGKIDYIFDCNGHPLAYFDMKSRQTVSRVPGIFFDEFTPYLEAGIRYFTLSMDLNMQNKINSVFRNFFGSMLLLKLDDNGMAAAYSKPLNREKINSVFTTRYEPGSIIKILTLFGFYQHQEMDFFPFECKRSLVLNHRIFADRMAHGTIENPAKALVVSCNIALARMGLKLGFQRLSKILDAFYFNSDGISDQFLNFATGRFNKKISTDFQLANLSVGLNEISITTFHAAFLALVVSQNGSPYSPYIIKNIKTILNLGFYNHQPEIINIYEHDPIYSRIARAMNQVVEDPDGTGRYSKIGEVQTAIKTGTAGNRKTGLDSIIIGFFPAAKPDYAFAFRLERAGKAELNGAAFLKEFLSLLYRVRK
jgi:hypothetical protein